MTISSPEIAGGELLVSIALRMVFPGPASQEPDVEDPFIVPLARPLVAGPSTIALLLLMSSHESVRMAEWTIALGIASAATTILLVSSPVLMRLFGNRGLRATNA
jgi:multiple antibiotic resistance protein